MLPRAVTTKNYLTMNFKNLINQKNSLEALSWLQTPAVGLKTLGELPTKDDSVTLVNELYSIGAVRVLALEICSDSEGNENTGKLLISLPVDVSKRSSLFDWCGECAEELGYDRENDNGQNYLFVMLD
jgi:hypothetical protein